MQQNVFPMVMIIAVVMRTRVDGQMRFDILCDETFAIIREELDLFRYQLRKLADFKGPKEHLNVQAEMEVLRFGKFQSL